MIRLYQFRDLAQTEAFVLAAGCDSATELFQGHLKAGGGDPDALLWREWPLDDLGEPEQSIVREAMALNREGLLTCDAEDRWVFVIALGDRQTTD